MKKTIETKITKTGKLTVKIDGNRAKLQDAIDTVFESDIDSNVIVIKNHLGDTFTGGFSFENRYMNFVFNHTFSSNPDKVTGTYAFNMSEVAIEKIANHQFAEYKISEPIDEANPDDYAVSQEAMDVAVDAETELANSEAQTSTPIINIADYNTMMTWAEKISNGQRDAVTPIKTYLSKLGYTADINEIFAYIEMDDLNGFRRYISQFPFLVKDDAGYIQKLYAQEDGQVVLAEIPTCEYPSTENNTAETIEQTIEHKEETQMTNNLPTGIIEVANGADAFALVAPYFPNGLTFKCAGKGFNHETIFSFADKNDDELWLNVCSTPDNKRIDCIEVLNTHENGSKCHPLTVAIVANEKERADKLINPPIDNTDDFQSKLAELQDEYDTATLKHEKAIDAVKAAEKALQAARELEQIAAGKRIKAGNAIYHFGSAKAAKLHEKILPIEITNRPSMIITNQFNCRRNIYLETLFIAFYEYKFSIIADTDYGTCTLGEYDTPAQVERVIKMLKAAVARGDKDFISPTVEELYGTHEKKACRKVG